MATRVLAGRYELIEKIGEGGMAVVFRARDRLLSRNVAIKILRPEFTKDMMFIESFRRESQLAASIVDPNIVNVYDVGKEGNIYYIVMELVEGEPLSEIIKREAPLDPKRAAFLTRQIAMALSTAHKHQLIHRDVKPHNVLVTSGDVAKISDFGIAMKQNPEEADTAEKKATVMGSIHYFSPEQARGAYVDERSDIYSLGIVLYEMLTGQVPFDGETAVEVALKHMNEPMVPPSRLNPNIPSDLEHIVMKATAKLQKDRYKNADEMITDLSFVKFSRTADQKKAEDKKTGEDAAPEETPEERKARIRAERIAAKRRKYIKMGVAALAVIIAIVVIVLLSKAAERRKQEEREKQRSTPYIIGMVYADAVEYLKQYGLGAEIENQLVSKEPVGTIISQIPEEGTTVKVGHIIKVNVSRGDSEDGVPTLAGKTQEDAQHTLEGLGFVLGEVSGAYSSTVERGRIISQEPAAGAKLEKGGKVDIVISLGPDESSELIVVPRLTGKTLEDAQKAIEEAGLVLEKTTEQESSSVDKGYIISQSIAAGSQVEKETKISLVVSTGYAVNPRPVEITIDYSKATEDSFQVTVTLSEPGGTSNVFVQQRTKTSAAEKVKITGTGESSKVKVFFAYPSGKIDTVYEYTVNFRAGTVQ
ncbi:MAG: Stk1 family PASTA domain-containing Ser/Thr kinase [Firmicutes bacterium]|nr:Stk1 family PASTA domain-containing Ser/Thr kinase [Bacillota bacterium]